MTLPHHEIADALLAAGTASVTWQLNRRGLWRCWMQGPKPLQPHHRCAGPAFTLRFVPAREDLATAESYRVPGALRDALEAVPRGSVVVCDGLGRQDMGIIGDMYATRLQVLGAAGFVTDTPVRDAEGIGLTALPVFCTGAAAPASIHALHYAGHSELIGCGGAAVEPDDYILADGDGVVVVPKAVAADVAAAAVEQSAREPFIQEKLKQGAALPGIYPPGEEILTEYEAWRKEKG